MTLVKIDVAGEPIWLNPDHVNYVKPDGDRCAVYLSNGERLQFERTAEEIVHRLVPRG